MTWTRGSTGDASSSCLTALERFVGTIGPATWCACRMGRWSTEAARMATRKSVASGSTSAPARCRLCGGGDRVARRLSNPPGCSGHASRHRSAGHIVGGVARETAQAGPRRGAARSDVTPAAASGDGRGAPRRASAGRSGTCTNRTLRFEPEACTLYGTDGSTLNDLQWNGSREKKRRNADGSTAPPQLRLSPSVPASASVRRNKRKQNSKKT